MITLFYNNSNITARGQNYDMKVTCSDVCRKN